MIKRRILVPLDGSNHAEAALPFAEQLATRLAAEIQIVHVSERAEHPSHNMCQAYLARMAETAEHEARKQPGKRKAGGIEAQSLCLVGDPASEIVDYAEREGIGLIVMATHGLSGVKRWALGSVADRVVRATNRPVLLVRPERIRDTGTRPRGTFERILVPLDGSSESEAILPYVRELAVSFNAEMLLVEALEIGYYFAKPGGYDYIYYPATHTAESKERALEYLETIAQPLKQAGITVRSEVRLGDPAGEILHLAEEASVDLVAMSTHGRSGLARWAIGSVATKVLHEGKTPLLLVRPAKEAK